MLTRMNVRMFFHVRFLMKPLPTILTRIRPSVRMNQEMSWQGWTSFKRFSTLFAGENSFTVVYSSENKNNDVIRLYSISFIYKRISSLKFKQLMYRLTVFIASKNPSIFMSYFMIHVFIRGILMFYHKTRIKQALHIFQPSKVSDIYLFIRSTTKQELFKKALFWSNNKGFCSAPRWPIQHTKVFAYSQNQKVLMDLEVKDSCGYIHTHIHTQIFLWNQGFWS